MGGFCDDISCRLSPDFLVVLDIDRISHFKSLSVVLFSYVSIYWYTDLSSNLNTAESLCTYWKFKSWPL